MYGMDLRQALYGYALANKARSEQEGADNDLAAAFSVSTELAEYYNSMPLEKLIGMMRGSDFPVTLHDGFIVSAY